MLNLTNLYCMLCSPVLVIWKLGEYISKMGYFQCSQITACTFFNTNIYVRNVSNFHISSREMWTNPTNSLEIAESDTLYRLFQNSRLTEAIHQLISHSSQDWSHRWNSPNLIVSYGCVGRQIYLNSPSDSDSKKNAEVVKNCLIL